VETLIEEAMRIAGEFTAAGEPSGPPVVSVS
jgi:(E)-4-hydroxy-3-methylbut-2-enyl-diphosphate synthase